MTLSVRAGSLRRLATPDPQSWRNPQDRLHFLSLVLFMEPRELLVHSIQATLRDVIATARLAAGLASELQKIPPSCVFSCEIWAASFPARSVSAVRDSRLPAPHGRILARLRCLTQVASCSTMKSCPALHMPCLSQRHGMKPVTPSAVRRSSRQKRWLRGWGSDSARTMSLTATFFLFIDYKADFSALICGSSRAGDAAWLAHIQQLFCVAFIFASGLNESIPRATQMMDCPSQELTTSGRVTRQLNWMGY